MVFRIQLKILSKKVKEKGEDGIKQMWQNRDSF